MIDKSTSDIVFAQSKDVVAREIEGEIIIIPLVAGIGDLEDELYSLNETGKAIWSKLDGKHTVQQIAIELSDEFDLPTKEIEQDVLGLTSELLKRKLLIVC